MLSGNAIEQTPLGSRLVFGFSVATYLLFVFDHHDFISLDLVCRPGDVMHGQPQRLLLASFAHTSFPGLCLAVVLSWRRFVWIEYQCGTLGFIVWFVSTSVVLHGMFCVAALCLGALSGRGLLGVEVHGLFPLLVASLVSGSRESDNATVWLWPLPLHVSARAFPLVVVGLCWLFHLQAHSDVVVAYIVAWCAPGLVDSDRDPWLLDQLEQTPIGCWLASCLGGSDAFVCRPPSALQPSSHRVAGGLHGASTHSLYAEHEEGDPSTLALERALETSKDDDDERSAEAGLPLTV